MIELRFATTPLRDVRDGLFDLPGIGEDTRRTLIDKGVKDSVVLFGAYLAKSCNRVRFAEYLASLGVQIGEQALVNICDDFDTKWASMVRGLTENKEN